MKTTSLLEQIGNTPLLKIETIYVKAEFLNPSGSVKDRIAKYIIEKAEQTGKLKKGDTIVEASTGNTGTALAMLGAIKGYKVIIFIPKDLTKERFKMMRAFGATIKYMPPGRVDLAVKKAKALGKRKGYFHLNQFANQWNVGEHERVTAPQILKQLRGKKVDAIVTGIGSGGSLIGLAKGLKKKNKNLKVYGVEPSECALTFSYLHDEKGVCKPHRIEGIADGFVPDIIKKDIHLIDEVIKIKSKDAIAEAKRIAKHHGCFVGVCSGANLLAAKSIQKKHPELKTIVTLFTDEGEKYLSEKWFSQ